MTIRAIRTYGDPILKLKSSEVADINGSVAHLIEDMKDTLRNSETGIGLAANQIGADKRIFIWDLEGEDDFEVLINPEIVESQGEWEYEEGCLSVPGLHWTIVRPKLVHVKGFDLDGNEVSYEADDLFGRLIQHELDHLDGKLLIEHLDKDQLKQAKSTLRAMAMGELIKEEESAAKPSRGL